MAGLPTPSSFDTFHGYTTAIPTELTIQILGYIMSDARPLPLGGGFLKIKKFEDPVPRIPAPPGGLKRVLKNEFRIANRAVSSIKAIRLQILTRLWLVVRICSFLAGFDILRRNCVLSCLWKASEEVTLAN
ncbi:hypothetical protein IFR05_014624 [Cadophora sp. M221]|nr:hypothetical protein IFR05_014624 [Cadophora sp. M221]